MPLSSFVSYISFKALGTSSLKSFQKTLRQFTVKPSPPGAVLPLSNSNKVEVSLSFHLNELVGCNRGFPPIKFINWSQELLDVRKLVKFSVVHETVSRTL